MRYESLETRPAARALQVLALLLALLPLACVDGAFLPEEPFVASVVVASDGAPLTVGIGETVQLNAVLQDADGNEISGRDVTWSSSNETVASVDQNGLVTGLSEGTATITAESEGQTGTASITVETPSSAPVASVAVSPGSATLAIDETVQLTAVLEDADGNELSGRDVTWSSSSESVASVDQDGLVTAVSEGTATITAESEGESGTASITVETPSSAPVASVAVSPGSATLEIDETVQLTAVLEDADGNELSGRDVTWSSNSEGVASVDQDGLVTAVSEGTATITAESEGQSGTASITVNAGTGSGGGSTTPNLKVAFIGDQGHGSNAVAVLELILSEGADMVLHQGDFDYGDDPDVWDAMITSVLGADYPYFASVGNHDDDAWSGTSGYQAKLQQRLSRVSGASCSGDLGVNSACTYQGLFFILSGVGTLGSGHESYIREQLSGNSSTWRICSWHKNQQAMQVGGKGNETGWGVYEACRELGALIATGHEHSYSRTKTLTSTQNQTVDPTWPDRNDLRVDEGATFVHVSGLAGSSIRDQERCLPTSYPYGCNGEWASIYTSNQGANYGALFIEFNVDGDPRKARGYFKDIDGNVIDQFTVTSYVNE